jgi:methionyl-tRNA formyltransferase
MKIIFAGTPEFSVPILQVLLKTEHEVIAVYTQPDKASGRGQQSHVSPVKQCALDHHIPVYQPISLKNPDEQQILKSLQPDLMIVVAYGLILPPIVLETPSLGCINVHASLLPRWRGASPIQQAILTGDSETGVCIMRMEAGLDTGPVFEKSSCSILPTDTAETLHDRLALLGAETLLYALPKIATQIPEKQPEEGACYAKKISKQDGLIDWNKTAREISCQVRAFNPWPVAFFYVDGQYVRVWEGEVVDEGNDDGKIPPAPPFGKGGDHSMRLGKGESLVHSEKIPGTLLKVHADGLDVIAGNQTVFRITRCQLANGKVLAVKDCLNAGRALFVEGKQFSNEH